MNQADDLVRPRRNLRYHISIPVKIARASTLDHDADQAVNATRSAPTRVGAGLLLVFFSPRNVVLRRREVKVRPPERVEKRWVGRPAFGAG
jgi:hypothetical protein